MNAMPTQRDDDAGAEAPEDLARTRRERSRHALHACIEEMIHAYFQDLDGHGTHDLHRLVMETVEPPMLRAVLRYTNGNQTRAAQILGINRGTLRKKLNHYQID